MRIHLTGAFLLFCAFAANGARAADLVAVPDPAARAEARIGGNPPPHEDLESKVLAIWRFVRQSVGAPADAAPLVFFAPFDPSRQGAEWNKWQKAWIDDDRHHAGIYWEWTCYSREGRKKYPNAMSAGACRALDDFPKWLKLHPEVLLEFPFSADTQGYMYQDADHIQLDPAKNFMANYKPSPAANGRMRDYVGAGYYVVGHEMLHYGLMKAGLPHDHCFMLTAQPSDGKSPMERVVEFLERENYTNSMYARLYLLRETEHKPCGATALRVADDGWLPIDFNGPSW